MITHFLTDADGSITYDYFSQLDSVTMNLKEF